MYSNNQFYTIDFVLKWGHSVSLTSTHSHLNQQTHVEWTSMHACVLWTLWFSAHHMMVHQYNIAIATWKILQKRITQRYSFLSTHEETEHEKEQKWGYLLHVVLTLAVNVDVRTTAWNKVYGARINLRSHLVCYISMAVLPSSSCNSTLPLWGQTNSATLDPIHGTSQLQYVWRVD